MRYERKYRIDRLDFDAVHQELILHNAGFSSQYPDRKINSIYFDDPNYVLARSTLSGASNRCKYRIRWYGESLEHIQNPVLEKKIKSNQLGYKELKTLPDFNLKLNFRQLCASIEFNGYSLFPVVYISYYRRYLISFDLKVRVTIDQLIEYRGIEHDGISAAVQEDKALVVEFKYDEDDAAVAESMMASLPLRVGKNSKYVNGVQGFWT